MALVRKLFLCPSGLEDHSRCVGCITGVKDGSAFTGGPAVGLWNDENNGSVNILVDSGASGHYFDDDIILRLRDKLDSYHVLDVPRKITVTGG